LSGEGLLVAALKIAAAVAIGLPLVLYLAQDSLIFYRQPLAEARSAQIARAYPSAQAFALAAADGSRLLRPLRPAVRQSASSIADAVGSPAPDDRARERAV